MSGAHICDLCGARFANKYQLGPHKRLCWNQHQRVAVYSDFTGSSEEDSPHSLPSLSQSDEPEAAIESESANRRVPRTPLFELSQREKKWGVVQVCAPSPRTATRDVHLTYDYLPVTGMLACLLSIFADLCCCMLASLQMQKAWKRYIRAVAELCTSEFWDTFKILRHQQATVINQVLKKMYNILKQTPLQSGHRWPTSVRSLNSRIKKKAGWFWDNVTHQANIDMRRFGLEGVNRVEFTFVDPLFVFLQQCDKLVSSGYKLVWEPCVRKNPSTGVNIYGAGIECGLLLRAATNSIPAGSGRVALLNLSWDGGNTGRTHYRHICFFKSKFTF